MKKCISLSNSDFVEKKISKNIFVNNSLKPSYFEKFHNETLFYIFYYMPRDALQNYAADELNKRKWKYHIDLALWFSLENQIEEKLENFYYFNPNEWKICKYDYGPLNKNSFMSENDISKLVKQQSNKSQNSNGNNTNANNTNTDSNSNNFINENNIKQN
jgi:CCR4-NOT transcription complex subunit 2